MFFDKKQRAVAHIQCVPKRHIKDWTCLRPADYELLEHMHKVGLAYLREKYPRKESEGTETYRFGFHSPGHNS